jgi:hypothetical protein
MTMKKLIASAILIGTATMAFAQTTANASITLQGVMEKKVAITVTGTGGYNALDMDASVTDLTVVTVNEYANVREGYTVTLSSRNAVDGGVAEPFFEGAVAGETLAYSVKYGGAAVTWTGGSATITDASAKTPLAGTNKSLAISYDAYAAGNNLGNDTYSDELTFTITAK